MLRRGVTPRECGGYPVGNNSLRGQPVDSEVDFYFGGSEGLKFFVSIPLGLCNASFQ